MDTSGQAAEMMVRYAMEGMEYTLKLTGKGTERLAAVLMALSKDQQKNKGKTTLNALLKSQKELKVFTIPENRLKDFAKESKRYGVLYCVLKEKKSSKDSLCDVLVRAEDAAKINRIVERLELNQVAVVAQEQPMSEPDKLDQEIRAAEDLLKQILTPSEQQQANPTSARMEALLTSGHGFTPNAEDIELLAPPQKPSVRETLEKIRQEQQLDLLQKLRKSDVALKQEVIIERKDR